jgi:hypothetical protein
MVPYPPSLPGSLRGGGTARLSFFGNPAVREKALTRGFASQPHDWFAFIGKSVVASKPQGARPVPLGPGECKAVKLQAFLSAQRFVYLGAADDSWA